MDYVLDIIIPKNEVKIVELNEKFIEWAEQLYPCEPPQYITDSDIIFEQLENTKYFGKIVEEELKEDTIVLNLKSDILFDLEYAVNNRGESLEQNALLVFLKKLLSLSKFYILLVREDEKVKERYEITTEEEISQRVSECLSWTNPKDVLLFKDLSKVKG